MAETRKLAAILAADVAGYSKLAGADEERTLARLRALRSDLSTLPSLCITAASLSGRAMASSLSSEALSMPSAAPSRCRTAWSSATLVFHLNVASSSGSASISEMWSRSATAT